MSDFSLQIKQAIILVFGLFTLGTVFQIDSHSVSSHQLIAASGAATFNDPNADMDTLIRAFNDPKTPPDQKQAIKEAIGILGTAGLSDLSGTNSSGLSNSGQYTGRAPTNVSNFGAGVSVDAGGSGAHPAFEAAYGTQQTFLDAYRYAITGNKYGVTPGGFAGYLYTKGVVLSPVSKAVGASGSGIQKSGGGSGSGGSSGSAVEAKGTQTSANGGTKSNSPAPGSGSAAPGPAGTTSKSPSSGSGNIKPVDAKTANSNRSQSTQTDTAPVDSKTDKSGGNAGGASSNSGGGFNAGGGSDGMGGGNSPTGAGGNHSNGGSI